MWWQICVLVVDVVSTLFKYFDNLTYSEQLENSSEDRITGQFTEQEKKTTKL